jgi:NADPH:quinone reductase-like Zn-dependent oxidoreductase
MKAVQVHEYGGADVLRFEDAPRPTVGDDDVLIRVIGTSVNPVDWKIRQGHLKQMLPFPFPFIPGWDVSGVVHEVGSRVAKFKVGDPVFSRPDIARNGTYAQFVAVREGEVCRKPRTISHVEAGVLPLAGIAAWEAIITVAKVVAGQRVLIHGAAGGVGSLAVQLAKSRGAYVIGTGSGTNRNLIESLGADEFLDYREKRLPDATRDIHVVFDTIGGVTQTASWAVMAPFGLMVSIVSKPDESQAGRPDLRGAYVFIKPNAAVLEQIAQLVDEGKLRPLVGAEFSLKDIQRAHLLSESGHARGKIAVYVNRP